MPALVRQAAVVRQHLVLAEPRRQLMRDALGKLARVDEDERAAMALDELHELLVDLGPMLVRAHGLQLHRRHFDGQIHVAEMADVHDVWLRTATRPDQEAPQLVERLLRRAEADADRPNLAQRFQPFE